MESKKIVIVGAGAAGLAAASKLFKSGIHEVVVLESDDRIGGRIWSVKADYMSSKTTEIEKSHTLEYGAQWVHGVEDNISYQMASNRNLLEVNVTDGFDNIKFLVDDPSFEVGIQQMFELVDNIYKSLDNVENPEQETHGNFFNRVFFDLIKDKDDDFQKQAVIFKDFYHRFVNSVEGCSNWNDLSFSGSLIRYKKCPGAPCIPFKSDRKYIDLLNILAEDIPAYAFCLNAEVVKISQTNDKLRVITKDGRDFGADYVIVTCSLGVLKDKVASLFEPQLPLKKLKAIETMEMGVVNKIFLEFEHPWWTGIFSNGIAFLYADVLMLNKEFSFSSEDAEKDWTRFLLGAYVVDNRPRVLCSWISGEGAKIMETLSSAEIKSGVMKTIRKFVSRVFDNVPEPVNVHATRWYTNPFTRGSYSYQTLTSEIESITPDDLAEPVNHLLFAGEATHHEYFSTVHGAIESGFREANRIRAALK